MRSSKFKCKPRLLQSLAFLLLVFAAGAENFEFVVIGDTRPRFESESFRPFQHLITKINAAQPAFVINLGDLIYGYGMPKKETQWDRYQAVIRAIEPPYYQCPGNHDTHSKVARRIYGRRFGKFYESFDHGDCHFVLLDTTEAQLWGYIGPAQFEWLKRDLSQTKARSVFVFTHFPIWEPERVTSEFHEFWAKTLHPLFKASRVRAVFAGHYHAYGPTREFDGITYFITGGGGAELRPEYRKSGGEYHFMRVAVSGDNFDVRVVTDHGEMTDSEADVMGGLQFASRHVSRIGIVRGSQDLQTGVSFEVSVSNPHPEPLKGEAAWLFDSSVFSIEPGTVSIDIPGGSSRKLSFTLKALQPAVNLQSLPRLQFAVSAGGRARRFHRELRFLERVGTPYIAKTRPEESVTERWRDLPKLRLKDGSQPAAEFSSCYDDQYLHVALTVPAADIEEVEELGFTDELQIGLARRSADTDFSSDFLRLGFSSKSPQAVNRTPNSKADTTVPGVKVSSRSSAGAKRFEIAIPLRLIRHIRSGSRLILDLSFPVADGQETAEKPEPPVNSLSYRIRYGSDSLVPVYFLELNFEGTPHKGGV